jgi:hypothetical protein
LFDTGNATDRELHHEPDDDGGVYYFDPIGRANVGLACTLRNAAPSLLAAARLALDARAFLEEHGEAIGGLLGSRASTLRDLHGNFTGARIVDGHAGALSALLARFKDAEVEALSVPMREEHLAALLAALPDERRASLLAEHLPRQVLINTHALATRATTAEAALAEKEAELAGVKAERDEARAAFTRRSMADTDLVSRALAALRPLVGELTRFGYEPSLLPKKPMPDDPTRCEFCWKPHVACACVPPAVETPVADAWNSKGPVYTQRPGEPVPEQGFINRDASRVGGKETK